MSNSIRIKRRASTGASGVTGVTLKNGELAYNEADDVLYYGYGVSGTNAAQIKPIAGNLPATTLSNYVNRTSDQSVGGVKTLTDLLKPNAGINVNSGKFTVASSTGNTVIDGTLNGHTIPSGSAGTFALTTDTLATHSGHSYIDIVEQDIVAGDVALGSHTSGNYVQSLAEYSTNPGISLAGDTPAEGNTITISVDTTVIRDFGAQSVGGVKTFTDLLNANGGIAVDTNKFTVADGTGNTDIAGTLEVDGNTVLNGGLDFGGTVDTAAAGDGDIVVIDGGAVKIKSNANVLTDIGAQPLNDLLTDLADIGATAAVANQFIVSTAAGTFALEGGPTLRTSIGVGTGNSPTFQHLTLGGDLHVNGGDIKTNAGTFNFLTDNASVEVLNIGDSGGNLATTFPGTVDIDAGLNVGSSNQFAVSSTGAITGTGANITSLNADNLSSGTVDTNRLPVATSTAKGAIELFSNTAQSEAANAVSTTASRTYGIQLNSAGQAVVNVPWTDDDTIYTHHTQSAISVSEDAVGAEVLDGIGITVNTEGHVTAASATKRTLSAADLGLGTTDDVEFDDLTVGNITTSGYLRGPSTFTIDPATHDDDTGKVIIAGDLQVDGTTTTINSTVVEIDDLATKVAAETTTSSTLTGAGVLIGTDPNSPPALSSGALVEFIYAHTGTRMELSSAMKITGGLEDTVIDGGTF